MEKKEQLLQIEPQNELKFIGEYCFVCVVVCVYVPCVFDEL